MWPFGPKQEVRNYTASVLDAFHSVATSGKGASAEGTFAVESGVRLLADVISTARIEGPAPIVDALKPILGSMARELLLRGGVCLLDSTGSKWRPPSFPGFDRGRCRRARPGLLGVQSVGPRT